MEFTQDGGPEKQIKHRQYYSTYCLVIPTQHLHSTMQANHSVPNSANVRQFSIHNSFCCKDQRTQRQYIKLEKKLNNKQKMKPEKKTLIKDEISKNRQDNVNCVADSNNFGINKNGEENSNADDENIQIITEMLSSVHPPKVRL